MDIGLYISDLLQKHDEISITGLGTFFKTQRAAFYDDQRDCFMPPGQHIDYKSDYEVNPLLAEYISEQRNISIGSSEHFIERFTADINNQLSTDQQAEVPHLGTIRKENDTLSFTAAETLDPDHLFFGLKPVNEIKTAKISPPNWDPVILNEVPAQPMHEIAEEEQESEPARKSKLPVLLLIIGILMLGAAAVYILAPQTIENLAGRSEKPSTVKTIPVTKPKTITDSITVADSIIQSLDQQGFEVEKPRDTLKITTQATPVNTPSVSYEVIGASLNSQADAERLVQNFKAKGIDARIILAKDKKRNNILISLGSFNNKPSASTELIRIKNDIEPGAYIYTYNKN